MKKDELIAFIKKFNASKPLDILTINNLSKTLTDDDLKLFFLLTNFKNGTDFLDKLNGGVLWHQL